MLTERFQILLSPGQRRRLEAEARGRGTSVAALIREAIDERFRSVSQEQRIRAVEEIRRMGKGRFLPAEAIDDVVESERAEGPFRRPGKPRR